MCSCGQKMRVSGFYMVIKKLHFLLSLNTVDVLIDFRDYKLTKRSISSLTKSFLCRLSVIPISSAACERGFSAMNAQKPPTRSRLLMKNLDGLLHVFVSVYPEA